MYVSANQQLLVAPARKKSCCTTGRVRGEPEKKTEGLAGVPTLRVEGYPGWGAGYK